VSILIWSSDYNVNIPAIDNEHKLLVSIVNDIAQGMNYQGALQTKVITESLHRLLNYVRVHFDSEERFLLFNNYPEFDGHKTQHAELLEKLERFEKSFKTENKPFDEKMLLYLKDWLVRHIILHDSKFGHYYRDKELI
jgi:hemerythrin